MQVGSWKRQLEENNKDLFRASRLKIQKGQMLKKVAAVAKKGIQSVWERKSSLEQFKGEKEEQICRLQEAMKATS